MKSKQIKLRPKSLVNGWWEIALRRPPAKPGSLLACLHHRKQVDREVLREAHKENPLADLGDLLRRLTQGRSLVVGVAGDPHDAAVQRVEQDDFDLDPCDVVAVAESIYGRLATELLPSEDGTSTVIDIRSWLRSSCYSTTASRIERTLKRRTSPPMVTKENP